MICGDDMVLHAHSRKAVCADIKVYIEVESFLVSFPWFFMIQMLSRG